MPVALHGMLVVGVVNARRPNASMQAVSMLVQGGLVLSCPHPLPHLQRAAWQAKATHEGCVCVEHQGCVCVGGGLQQQPWW